MSPRRGLILVSSQMEKGAGQGKQVDRGPQMQTLKRQWYTEKVFARREGLNGCETGGRGQGIGEGSERERERGSWCVRQGTLSVEKKDTRKHCNGETLVLSKRLRNTNKQPMGRDREKIPPPKPR